MTRVQTCALPIYQANAVAVVNLLAGLARETGAAIVCATHDPIVTEHADAELRLAAAVHEAELVA